MKSYLVDVPVRINIWIIPDCQKEQFEVIKKARPSILFIQSDGGRTEEEWKAIYQNRKLVDEGIDWECTVYRFYENENLGLYKMGHKVLDFIWKIVDRCILLEDDQIPTVSFFRFCAELLERYKDDERIECICGVNQLESWRDADSDYFFSRQGSIWGVATWKRVAININNRDYLNSDYVKHLLKQRTSKNKTIWKRIVGYSKSTYYEGHVASLEFLFELDMYSQNRLQIIPKKNMISYIGANNRSEHADELKMLPRGIRRVFNMKIYEIEFPLNNPEYVIPDIKYEKYRNRVMGYNFPWIVFVRKMERLFLMIRYGKIDEVIEKFRNKEIEK